MTKSLLALLFALQKATLDAHTQSSLLPQLGNKLAALSKKPLHDLDRDNIQAKINDILARNPSLSEQHQRIVEQLQTWTDDQLKTLLPTAEQLKSLQPQNIPTLGYPPAPLPPFPDELENIIVDVAKTILRHQDLIKASQALLPGDDTIQLNQQKSDRK